MNLSMDYVAPKALENDFKLTKHKFEYLQNLDSVLIYQVHMSQVRPS